MTLYLIAISLQCNSKYLKSKLKNKNTVNKNLCIHAYFISWSHLSAPLAILRMTPSYCVGLSTTAPASLSLRLPAPTTITTPATLQCSPLSWPQHINMSSTPDLCPCCNHSDTNIQHQDPDQHEPTAIVINTSEFDVSAKVTVYFHFIICIRMAGFNKIHTLLYLKNFNLSKYCTQEHKSS